MSFTVQKSLGNSFFRFSVARRRELRSIDPDPELSTGSSGEFIRHRPEIFYSADIRTIRTPEVPAMRTLSGTSFMTSLMNEPRGRTWGLIGAGALLILWGLALVARNPAGLLFLLIGLVLIGIPFFFTARKRRHIKLEEQRRHRERAERDARNRELLAAYTASLERLREDPNDAALEQVLRENEKLDLPYSLWADTAIGTALYVGFSTLARIGPERAAEVANLMDRASDASGLIAEDALAVKHALYSTVLWHFLADDRLGEAQLKVVRAVQQGFAIKPEDVPIDTSSEQQFERLRGIDHRNAPRCDATIALGLNEYCLYNAQIRPGGGEGTTGIYITNKRVIVEGTKRIEAHVASIDDILVDADANRVTISASGVKRAVDFTAGEPIYLAAMADLATRLDDRPKSFT
ncbi:MAG TPA: hypothetical protein VNA69_17045 [Thermoanaerobaculia bacterium]|nr:hypothetical protein [Thermoanaerobaculia bacterium]